MPSDGLGAGEVGYLITGVKDVRQARVGDTVTLAEPRRHQPLPGYHDPQADGVHRPLPDRRRRVPGSARRARQAAAQRRRALYEPETSTALGFGFRCGFLGLLHMEIVQERLEREFGLEPDLHRAERRLPRRHGKRGREIP